MRRHVAFFALLLLAPIVAPAQVIDRIVTVVLKTPILQSDWDDEVRFEAFMDGRPIDSVSEDDRKGALERLIDQALIEQQVALSNYVPAKDAEIDAAIAQLRAQLLPKSTPETWNAALDRYGLTDSVVRHHVKRQLNQMRYIELRFRPDTHIPDAEVAKYYREQFLPELQKAGGKGKPLAEVQDQIVQILTEQRISDLLTAWLKNLHEQAGIADHERTPARTAVGR